MISSNISNPPSGSSNIVVSSPPTTTTTSSKNQKLYDVTIFGATGFTGTLITRYLIQRLSSLVESDSDLMVSGRRFCIAGRNESRLNELVMAHNIKMSDKGRKDLIIDVAVISKVEKGPKLLELTGNTKVLLNVAGPFIACGGLEIVDSCVETGTDYLDITGEPEYVLESAQKFHDKARENNVKIIHCCGFDSIPADLGTNISLFHVKNKLEELGISQTDKTTIVTNGYLSLNLPGFVSYGTFNTLVTSLENYSVFSGKKTSEKIVQRTSDKKGSYSKRGTQYHAGLQNYIVPFSTSDPLIVRRSNHLIGYDTSLSENTENTFEYNNYLQLSNRYYLFLMIIFFMIMFICTRLSFGARFLRFLYSLKPNPTQKERDESSFEFVFETFGKVTPANSTDPVLFKCKTRMYNNNDPGYTETAVYCLDSALFLLNNSNAARSNPGVLTPSSVFGVEQCKEEYLRCLGQHTTLKFDFVEFAHAKGSENPGLKKEVEKFLKL